jgi:hypothetical protein
MEREEKENEASRCGREDHQLAASAEPAADVDMRNEDAKQTSATISTTTTAINEVHGDLQTQLTTTDSGMEPVNCEVSEEAESWHRADGQVRASQKGEKRQSNCESAECSTPLSNETDVRESNADGEIKETETSQLVIKTEQDEVITVAHEDAGNERQQPGTKILEVVETVGQRVGTSSNDEDATTELHAPENRDGGALQQSGDDGDQHNTASVNVDEDLQRDSMSSRRPSDSDDEQLARVTLYNENESSPCNITDNGPQAPPALHLQHDDILSNSTSENDLKEASDAKIAYNNSISCDSECSPADNGGIDEIANKAVVWKTQELAGSAGLESGIQAFSGAGNNMAGSNLGGNSEVLNKLRPASFADKGVTLKRRSIDVDADVELKPVVLCLDTLWSLMIYIALTIFASFTLMVTEGVVSCTWIWCGILLLSLTLFVTNESQRSSCAQE